MTGNSLACDIGAALLGQGRGDGPQFRLGRVAVGFDEALREHVLRSGRRQISALQLGLQVAHCAKEISLIQHNPNGSEIETSTWHLLSAYLWHPP